MTVQLMDNYIGYINNEYWNERKKNEEECGYVYDFFFAWSLIYISFCIFGSNESYSLILAFTFFFHSIH